MVFDNFTPWKNEGCVVAGNQGPGDLGWTCHKLPVFDSGKGMGCCGYVDVMELVLCVPCVHSRWSHRSSWYHLARDELDYSVGREGFDIMGVGVGDDICVFEKFRNKIWGQFGVHQGRHGRVLADLACLGIGRTW